MCMFCVFVFFPVMFVCLCIGKCTCVFYLYMFIPMCICVCVLMRTKVPAYVYEDNCPIVYTHKSKSVRVCVSGVQQFLVEISGVKSLHGTSQWSQRVELAMRKFFENAHIASTVGVPGSLQKALVFRYTNRRGGVAPAADLFDDAIKHVDASLTSEHFNVRSLTCPMCSRCACTSFGDLPADLIATLHCRLLSSLATFDGWCTRPCCTRTSRCSGGRARLARNVPLPSTPRGNLPRCRHLHATIPLS